MLSPMTVWSMGPVPEASAMAPAKSSPAADQPLALAGSFDVRYEKVVGPH